MSEPSLVVILVRTVARSPSMLSPMNWIFSPPYTSIFEMYERSRRSAKSWTNSARSAGVRGAQWRALGGLGEVEDVVGDLPDRRAAVEGPGLLLQLGVLQDLQDPVDLGAELLGGGGGPRGMLRGEKRQERGGEHDPTATHPHRDPPRPSQRCTWTAAP